MATGRRLRRGCHKGHKPVHYQLRHQYRGAQTTKARPETRKALRAVVLGRFPHGQYNVSTIHIRSPRKATSYRSAYFEAVFPKLRITIFASRGKHQQMLLTYKLHPRLCQQEEAGCRIGSPHHMRKSLRQYKEALQPALSRLPGAGVPPASCLVSNQTRTSHAESDRSKEALITSNRCSEVSNINLIDTGRSCPLFPKAVVHELAQFLGGLHYKRSPLHN